MTPEQIKERLEELVRHWDESMRKDKDKMAMAARGQDGLDKSFIDGCYFQTYICQKALLNIIKDL